MEKAREFQKNIYLFTNYVKAFVWITTNWKILKEMVITDYLTCFLRNFYAGQEATVRTRHVATHWFKIGKGISQGCILSPCLFNLYVEFIMWNAGFYCSKYRGMNHKLESRLLGEIATTSARWYHSNGRRWRGTRAAWWGWNRREKKLA